MARKLWPHPLDPDPPPRRVGLFFAGGLTLLGLIAAAIVAFTLSLD